MSSDERQRIAALNDRFRTTFNRRLGDVYITRSVAASLHYDAVLDAVRRYRFSGVDGNNPWGENDFGKIAVPCCCGAGATDYLFKIDYYDKSGTQHSADPADADVTKRVLTIMRASEW